MFFVSPGTKEKQKHYILLTLRDGSPTLIVRGRKKQDLTLPVRVNDGHWHRIHLNTLARTATLGVSKLRNGQGTNSSQIKLPKRLNASNKIFVGGLPEEGLSLPGELVAKLEGFKGCMKRFSVNNLTQDLAKQNSHVNVGQCFPRVEKGSYFPGDAYAVYSKNIPFFMSDTQDFFFRTKFQRRKGPGAANEVQDVRAKWNFAECL